MRTVRVAEMANGTKCVKRNHARFQRVLSRSKQRAVQPKSDTLNRRLCGAAHFPGNDPDRTGIRNGVSEHVPPHALDTFLGH